MARRTFKKSGVKRKSDGKTDSKVETVPDKAKEATKKEKEKEEKIVDLTEGDEDEESPVASSELKAAEEEEESDDSDGSDDSNDDSDGTDDDDDDDDDKEKVGFTDENSKWLVPVKKKTALLDDDSDSDSDDNNNDNNNDSDSDDDTASSSDSLLSVEREARRLDEETAADEELAEADRVEGIARNVRTFRLPTAEESTAEEDGDRVVPPSELRERVDSVLEVLADFKSRREPNRDRSEYVARLSADLAALFGYLPELVDHFLEMFSPSETLAFLEASDVPRPVVLRTNTLRTRRKDLAQALIKRGVDPHPLAEWSRVGLRIADSPVPLGATPEYLAGHYMLQSAASMCPVVALGPRPNERVLDVAAAPGGKTTHMAQAMRNAGTIVSNDADEKRHKATIANAHRLGVTNVVARVGDGRDLGAAWPNRFDRVLLDSPCSGLGVASRDPSVKVRRTLADVKRTVRLQKELILSALDALRCAKESDDEKHGGGVMVYSTCSVSVWENEEVVQYLLDKRDVKIVDTGLDFGKPGFTRFQQKRFHPSLALSRRFYAHVHNMDGFFVCKIRKISDKKFGGINAAAAKAGKEKEKKENNKEKAKDDDAVVEETTEKNKNAKEKSEDGKKETSTETTVSKKNDSDNDGTERFKFKKRAGKQNEERKKQKGKFKRAAAPIKPNNSNKRKKPSTNAKVTKPRRVKT